MSETELVKPAWETPAPANVAGSYGEQVERWAKRRLDLTYEPWQSYAMQQALRHDADGNLIARQVLISTGRQSGKTVLPRTFAGWMLDQAHRLPAFRSWTTMLAAAHDAKQARVLYEGVYNDMTSTAALRASVKATRYFRIRAANGLDLDTVTSQPGSARGKSAGALLWDEMLTQEDFRMVEVLLPAQSAQRSPIAFMTSTAGFARSVVLRAYYDRLVRIVRGDLAPADDYYAAWWQADDDDAGLDWDQLRKANPSLDGGRLSRAAIRAEYEILPRASWVRERLNRWADERADAPFSFGAWGKCRVNDPLASVPGPFVIAIEAQADLSEATIAVAARRSDGRIGTEIHRHITTVTGNEVVNLVDSFAARFPVTQIAYLQTSTLAPALARAEALSGLPYLAVNGPQMQKACADLAEAVASERIAHGDPLLDAEMSGAARRMVGKDGAWRWSTTASSTPITTVIATTLAVSLAADLPARAGFHL